MKIFEHISANEIKTNFLMYSHAAEYKNLVTNLLEINFVHRKALFLQVLIFSIKCMHCALIAQLFDFAGTSCSKYFFSSE